MTASDQPRPHSPGDAFVPEYRLPDWYLDHATPPADPAPVAWHSVDNPAIDFAARCRMCAAAEVAPVTIRAHLGLLVWMRGQALDGPWCRKCGTSLIRKYSTRTLCLGWWSPLSLLIAAPAVLVANARAYLQIRRLPPPVPLPGHPQPDPGKPILLRPRAYVALIPVATLLWLLTAALGSLT
ncbi:hypothetical protein AB0D34_07980 [Streptomyces sp. NPDC048420]|uniref:hypothetical protein n=1 Tax=Streptomyces sp. NPDC048420 TaxID=3155755 RepID=UPI003428A35C